MLALGWAGDLALVIRGAAKGNVLDVFERTTKKAWKVSRSFPCSASVVFSLGDGLAVLTGHAKGADVKTLLVSARANEPRLLHTIEGVVTDAAIVNGRAYIKQPPQHWWEVRDVAKAYDAAKALVGEMR